MRQVSCSLSPACLPWTPDCPSDQTRSQVPILYLPDGSSVSESAAMILHLDDLFPGTLLPKRGDPARAQGYRWLLFAVANTHETILRWFYTDRYTTGDPAPVRAAAGERLQKLFGIIASNAFPDNGPYVLGKEPSAVDWHVLMTTEWLEKTGLRDGILEACPKIAKLVDLVHEDEVVRKVWVEHGFLKE